MDTKEYVASAQRGATGIVLKKNEKNIQMIKEWLRYAQDERILTDLPNTCGLENYDGFIGHKHDQSIFSLLSKKYNMYANDNALWVDFWKRKGSAVPFCRSHTTSGSILTIPCYRAWYKVSRHLYRIYAMLPEDVKILYRKLKKSFKQRFEKRRH